MSQFVTVRNVVRRFGSLVAVDNANLEVEQGQVLALLGPSGCGKTTLLRILGGLDAPDSGVIEVGGREMNGPHTFVPPEQRQVVLVFQDFALFPHMDVGKNIAFGVAKGVDRRQRVAELLDLVGLAGLEKRMPHQLSGGQQQRVALARALAANPRLILLDEPFSNLDPSIRARVREEVRALIRKIGITAIFVTHDQDEALSLSDRVAVMIGGRILQLDTPAEIYANPATRGVAEFMGNTAFIPGDARDGKVSCELGVLPMKTPLSGRVDVLIRAEDVDRDQDGTKATVDAVSYLGHEQMVTLRLAAGSIVLARWRADEPVAVGESVCVRARGPVHVFPV